jgi:hypothetical protein
MSTSVTVQSHSNLPANVEEEALNILATTKGHERLLKFVKGKYKVQDDEVSIGREFIAHANQLTTGWIKFQNNAVVERRMGRRADGFVPPERDEIGDLDQSQWEVSDGVLKDPWTLQCLIPFEDPESGEVVVFTTSSIGGRIATEALAREWAKRIQRTKSRAMPIVRLGVTQMKTKKFGEVARPNFEIVGWEDAPAVSTASTMRVVNNDDLPPEPPPFTEAQIEKMRAEANSGDFSF